jgi:hypothetical protein
MLRELPQFYMFPSSHGNISFSRMGKKGRRLKKKVVYLRRVLVPVLVHSSEVWEHAQVHTLGWPSLTSRHSFVWESPLQLSKKP